MGCGIKGVDARSLSVWLLLGSSNVYYQETYQAIVISRVKIIRIVKKKYLMYLCLSTPLCLLHLNVARSVPGLSSNYFSSLIMIWGTTADTGQVTWRLWNQGKLQVITGKCEILGFV